MTPISNLHVRSNIPLPSPMALAAEIPPSEANFDFVVRARSEIAGILAGRDQRFLLIAGPCSIHDAEDGLKYAVRFAKLARRVSAKALLVMRVYFEKPRTSTGWKGLIMDPWLDGTNDIPSGLRHARKFLRDVISLGIPTATEMLDPITPQYIADLTCWSAIGARTTESQTHRQMASGLSMPVGFKNTTSGGIQAAINAMQAAIAPQTFLGISPEGLAAVVTTTGNPDSHLILRGGEHGPNHDRASVLEALDKLTKAKFPAFLVIDASHANCGKDYRQMPGVFREIMSLRLGGLTGVCGAMLESHLHAGTQPFPVPLDQLKKGVSITDSCISWETTEALVLDYFGQAADCKSAGVVGRR